MAADGTVTIDLKFPGNKEEFHSDVDSTKQILKKIGANTGDHMKDKFKENSDKVKNQSEQTKNDVNKNLGGIKKEVITKLVASAEEAGIKNFREFVDRIPKERVTELEAKANRGDAINWQEEMSKMPREVITKMKIDDNKATVGLDRLKSEARETGSKFSHLKEIIAGSFIGQAVYNGMQNMVSGLKDMLAAGMAYNKEQDTMRTVWTSLTMQAPKDGKQVVDYINSMASHSIYAASSINEMAQSFYHVHSSVAETKQWTKDFVALGSTLHMTGDQLSEAGEMFAKMQATGKATEGDIQVMVNRFPMFGEALEKVTGKSMRQIYALTRSGKLSSKTLEEALDELGEKYKHSQSEAMTSMMGMGMYIQQRWSTLMGDVTKSSFNMSKKTGADIRDLLSDKMLTTYAQGISKVISGITGFVVKIIDYVNAHKITIVDIIGDLSKIAGIVARTIWETFSDTLAAIGEAFGIVKTNGKGSVDPLNTIKQILDWMVQHKEGVQNTVRILTYLFMAKKALDFASAIGKVKAQLTGLLGLQKQEKTVQTDSETVPTDSEKVPTTRLGKVRGKVAAFSNTAIGGMISNAGYIGTAYNVGGDAIKTAAGSSRNREKNASGAIGAAGLGGLGFVAGNALAPGIGGALGAWAGSSAGKFIGEKIGKSIQKGLDGTPLKPKISTNASSQTKKLEDTLQKGVNSFNKKVLIKVNADPKNLAKSKKDVRSALSDMYKANANYYENKKKQAKKDIEQEVSNGEISAKQGKAQLKAAYKIYDDREHSHKKLISSMQSATNSYYKKVNKIQNDSSKTQAEKEKDILKAHKQYVDQMVKDEMRLGTAGIKSAAAGAKKEESIRSQLMHSNREMGKSDYDATVKEANKIYNAAVKPVRKQRDDIIAATNEQYEKTKATATRQYKDLHTISRNQYDKVVKNARDQRDDTNSAAKEQYRKNTKTADDERGKTVSLAKRMKDTTNSLYKERSRYTYQIMKDSKKQNTGVAADEATGLRNSAHSGAKSSVHWWNNMGKGTNDILKGIERFFNPILKAFGQSVFNVSAYNPEIPEFAKGTGSGSVGRYTNALVGELGAEMRFNPTKGTADLLGVNGPEIRSLEPDDHILTADDTKKLSMPSFASGTDSILGFAKKAWDSAASKISNLSKSIMSVLSHPVKAVEGWFSSLMKKFTLGKPGTMMNSLGKGMMDRAEKGAKDVIQKIANVFSEDGGGGANPTGSGVLRWRGTVERALRAAGLPASSAYVNAWLRQIATESSGNPHAVQGNIGDINNITGDLARGLVQTTGSTFAQYGHGSVYNGFDDLLAGIKYSIVRYGRTGMLDVIGHGHGYANGGEGDREGYYKLFEGNKKEFIVPTATGIDRTYEMIGRSASYAAAKGGLNATRGVNSSALEQAVNKLVNLQSSANSKLEKAVNKKLQVFLDTGKLVGGMYPKIDQAGYNVSAKVQRNTWG